MVHCHVLVLTRDARVTGGHLLKATVCQTNEIYIRILEGIELKRQVEESGLPGLYPEEGREGRFGLEPTG